MNKEQISLIRKSNLGRQLHELDKYFKFNTLKYIQENGFPYLTYGQLSLLIHLKTCGATPANLLIESLGVSKQAVSKMLIQCEKLNLIEKASSKLDRRKQDILIGSTGHEVLKIGIKSIAYVENEIKIAIGENKFNQMKEILTIANLNLDTVQVD